MADGQDPLATIAPPPTGYLPAPTDAGPSPAAMQPPQVSPDQAAAQFPYPGSGTASDVLSNSGAAPAQPPQQMPPLPDETQQHMSLLHRILDKVGTILGGDETLHVTKDADGNITMTKDPSTEGEKWGRIAQAALTGAGVGFAASQGPGGMAKAAGAGIQAGLNLPQQNQQQNEQEVSFQNKQLLDQANRAHIQQQGYLLAQQVKANKLILAKDALDNLNQAALFHSQNPKAIDFGTIDPGDPQSLVDKTKRDPRIMAAHLGQGDLNLHYVQEANGQVHLYGTPKSDDEKLNDVPMSVLRFDMDTTDPNKPIPRLISTMNNPGSNTVGQIHTSNEAEANKYFDALVKKGNADKAEAEAHPTTKPPTNDAQGIYEEELGKTPDDPTGALGRANGRINQQKQTMTPYQRDEINLRQAELNLQKQKLAMPGGGNMEAALNAAYDENSPYDILAGQLADGKQIQKDVFARMPAATRTYINARASKLSQMQYGMDYNPSQIRREDTFANAPKTQGYFNAVTALIGGTPGVPTGILDNLSQAAKDAGLGEDPIKNAAMLTAARNPLTAEFMDKDRKAKIDAFVTARNEALRNVTTAAGAPLVSGSDSDHKLKQMEESLQADAITLSGLNRSINQVKTSATAERDANMEKNRFLKQTYGGGAISQPQRGAAQPQQPQQQQQRQQPTVPPGKFAHRTNGVIDGYADDQKGTNYVPLK